MAYLQSENQGPEEADDQIRSAIKHGNILRLMRYTKLMYPSGNWSSFDEIDFIDKLKF